MRPVPVVAGSTAADRLMRSLDYRLADDATVEQGSLTRRQVAIVVRALADHTAIQSAMTYAPDEGSRWPVATSLGRWFHAVADDLEAPDNGRGTDG